MAWGCKISKHHGFDTDYIDVEWRCAAFYNITDHFWKVKSVRIPLLMCSVVLFSITYRILLSSCAPSNIILWENKTKWHIRTQTRNADDTAGRKMCVCLSVILWCLFWFPSAKIHAFGTVKEDLQYDISILIPPNTSYQQFYISSIKKLSFLMGHVDQDYFWRFKLLDLL